MIVDEPYTVNERYGVKLYCVGVYSPYFNGFITWQEWSCKVTKTKKIEKLRNTAIKYAKDHSAADEPKWHKVEYKGLK